MRELIDQDEAGSPDEGRVQVELPQTNASVVDLLAWQGL